MATLEQTNTLTLTHEELRAVIHALECRAGSDYDDDRALSATATRLYGYLSVFLKK